MADPKAPAVNPRSVAPNRVRIYVNRDITFDLEKMNRITAAALGKLGCPNCHSGHILDFRAIEDFVVNPKTLEVQDLPGGHFGG